MTTGDLAEYLRVPRSRVYDCYRKWNLPHFKIGTDLRFRPEDVDAWLLAQRETGASSMRSVGSA